jgi:hypothetical protein
MPNPARENPEHQEQESERVSPGTETPEFSTMAVSTPLFELGQVVATPGAFATLESEGINPAELVGRHVTGDWGDLSPSDWAANDQAVKDGERLLSSYRLSGGAKVWIITEWDRSVTTLLLPSEY